MIVKVKEILEAVQNNQITIEDAVNLIDHPMDYADIDFDRQKRTGVGEVIYGAGKSQEQIAGIIQNMLDHDVNMILATRISKQQYEYLRVLYPDLF